MKIRAVHFRIFLLDIAFDGAVQDETVDFKGNAWTVERIVNVYEDEGTVELKVICIALVANVELPTDPLLRGRWLCKSCYFSGSR